MIWGPEMKVTWVWFDPAVTKKHMKSDLGFCIGRKCQIESTFPLQFIWTHADECMYRLQAVLYTLAHTEQKHIQTTDNDSFIPIATTRPQKSVWCAFMCSFATVQVCLYLHHKGEAWTSCVPRTPLHTWSRSPSPRMCSDTWLCSPSCPVWEGNRCLQN